MVEGRRASLVATWSALVLCIALCLPALVVGLRERPSTHTMEHIALLSSQETWLRQLAGDESAWLMPTNNGVARIVKPPLLVWLNLAAWQGLPAEPTNPQELIYRARLVSVATGVLMLAAIFWLGKSLGGLQLAAISALAAGAMMYLQRQSRTASYDIEFTAWATLAVAAGVWAIAPLEMSLSRLRRWTGWIVAGVCMGLSWMTKNPLALVLAIPPLVSAVITLPRNGRRDWMGLLVACFVCVLVIAPWHLYAVYTVPDAIETFVREFKQSRTAKEVQPLYYYLSVFGLVFPWCFALIAGMYHPFDWAWRDVTGIDEPRARRIRLWPWIWFFIILIFFSSVSAKQQRYILPIMAPATLLIAQVWCDHALVNAKAPGRVQIRWLSRPHWLLLVVASIACAVVGVAGIVHWRLPEHVAGALPLDGWYAVGLGAALLVVALLGWAVHESGRIISGALLTVAWSLIAGVAFWFGYAHQPTPIDAVVASSREVRSLVGPGELRYVSVFGDDVAPEEEFRFYFGDFVRPATRADLESGAIAYVLAEPREAHRALLSSLGYHMVKAIAEGPKTNRELWLRETATTP